MFSYILLFYNFVVKLNIGIFIFTNHSTNTKNSLENMPFFLVVGIVGGCIALTLLYVSWRKYKGDQNNQKKNN